MSKEVKRQIIEWIFNNHQHHAGTPGISMSLESGDTTEMDDETICEDGDVPYVNSLELEKFIKSIEVKN